MRCLLCCSDAFVAPSENAVGQLMRRKSDLNYKILQTSSSVVFDDYSDSLLLIQTFYVYKLLIRFSLCFHLQ